MKLRSLSHLTQLVGWIEMVNGGKWWTWAMRSVTAMMCMSWKIWGSYNLRRFLWFTENLRELIWVWSAQGEACCSHCLYIPTWKGSIFSLEIKYYSEKEAELCYSFILKIEIHDVIMSRAENEAAPFPEQSFFFMWRSFVWLRTEGVRLPVEWEVGE